MIRKTEQSEICTTLKQIQCTKIQGIFKRENGTINKKPESIYMRLTKHIHKRRILQIDIFEGFQHNMQQ